MCTARARTDIYCGRAALILVHTALQGAVELSDEGTTLLASACKLLQGPAGTELRPEQCKFVNVDLLASFWLVRLPAATRMFWLLRVLWRFLPLGQSSDSHAAEHKVPTQPSAQQNPRQTSYELDPYAVICFA